MTFRSLCLHLLKYMHQVLRQFPDCRFVYVLFRSRTLGYDIYPEDHFLRTFPWQQYGGLWVVDEARFARAGSLNTCTAQALRRVTGIGASPHTSDSGSPISPFATGRFQQLPGTNDHMRDVARSQHPSSPHSFDSSVSSSLNSIQYRGGGTPFEVQGPQPSLSYPAAMRPQLTLLTDVGRRYPGFPTPLSPTLSAKGLFPSPTSESESWVMSSHATTPALRSMSSRGTSPALRSTSPMSLDGSEMCGPSRRCNSHGYEHYASQMGLIDDIISQNSINPGLISPPSTPPSGTLSHAILMSPRSAISANHSRKHSSANPQSLAPGLQYHPSTVNVPGTAANTHTHLEQVASVLSPNTLSSSRAQAPVIQIANGTEVELESPYSSTGTILSYTSNRTVESGLLAVPPLSEPCVAEYRFWVPCGRKTCTFGCGFAHEGEAAASKRLFKEIEEVKVTDGNLGITEDCDFSGLERRERKMKGTGAGYTQSPALMDWAQFLKNREREGIAPV
jgi:hypothetical protein